MRKLFFISLICLALALLAPLAGREAFFRMPDYSDSFDCDDGALLMLDRLQSIGITATPVLGNLEMTGERYPETNHVWVLAEIAGRQVALDGGFYCPDRQHYEGFLLSKQQLMEFVAQDLDQTGQTVGNPADR